jgi:hypothetical protein
MQRTVLSVIAATLLLATIGSSAIAQESGTLGTWAFEHPNDRYGADALLDLRFLNEKVAGESGFIKRTPDGNDFALGNGKPIRFWAVGSDVYREAPEAMARQARFLAKLGVNMIRMHTQIAPTGPNTQLTDVNEKEIDGIQRCVAAMKKEGIYSTISPYWATGKDASQWGIDGYTGTTDLWGLLFFNEKLQAGYKAWVKALYTRPNPYTGIPLAQDPAVAIIQVQNEDSLLFWTTQGIKPEQQRLLGLKFGKWLVAKYGSLDAAKAAWGGTGNDKDDFANGVVGLYNIWPMTQEQAGGMAKRVNDECEFYAETQRKFYADIADYYHNTLGCKQLINASNWQTADAIKLNDIERWTYTADDVIAVNRYTGGVHTGDNDGWRIDPGHHFTNESCITHPRNLPTNLKQVVGHPFIITESTWVSPEGYQSEGPFLIAAYESLTGIDTYYWFATGAPEYEPNPYFTFTNFPAPYSGQHAMMKWTCATPMLMGQFPAAALMYRMGYVQRGETVVHEERPLEDLWQRKTPMIAEDRGFDPNRLSGNTSVQSNVKKGVDPLAFEVGPVEVKYGGDPADDRVLDLSKYIDHDKQTIKSVTGELTLSYGSGLCTLNAPKAQGATGALSGAGEIKLKDVTLVSKNGYASVLVVSMDDKPLNESQKILVQVGTYARPTGWQSKLAEFKSDDGKQTFKGHEIVNTGAMPWQIANTEVTLTIANPNIQRAELLDTAGYPAQEIPGKSAGGVFTLKLPTNTMYLILHGK